MSRKYCSAYAFRQASTVSYRRPLPTKVLLKPSQAALASEGRSAKDLRPPLLPVLPPFELSTFPPPGRPPANRESSFSVSAETLSRNGRPVSVLPDARNRVVII